MQQNSAALAAPPFHVGDSRLGALMVASGHRLVAWGERVSARPPRRPRAQARMALELHADARRDAQALLQSGLPPLGAAAQAARSTAPARSTGA
jgi:hypothetical protein